MRVDKDKDVFVHRVTGITAPRIKLSVPYGELKKYGYSYFKYYAKNYIMYSKRYKSGLDANIWKSDNAYMIKEWDMWTKNVIDYMESNKDTCFNKRGLFRFFLSMETGIIIDRNKMDKFVDILSVYDSKEKLTEFFWDENRWENVYAENQEFLNKFPEVTKENYKTFSEMYLNKNDYEEIVTDLKNITTYFNEETKGL